MLYMHILISTNTVKRQHASIIKLCYIKSSINQFHNVTVPCKIFGWPYIKA